MCAVCCCCVVIGSVCSVLFPISFCADRLLSHRRFDCAVKATRCVYENQYMLAARMHDKMMPDLPALPMPYRHSVIVTTFIYFMYGAVATLMTMSTVDAVAFVILPESRHKTVFFFPFLPSDWVVPVSQSQRSVFGSILFNFGIGVHWHASYRINVRVAKLSAMMWWSRRTMEFIEKLFYGAGAAATVWYFFFFLVIAVWLNCRSMRSLQYVCLCVIQ